MKLRERIYQQYTGKVLPKRLKPEYEIHKSNELAYNGFTSQRVYRLTLSVSTTFAANQAEYHHARENAEKMLVDAMFHDMAQLAREAMNQVYMGNQDEAIELLNELIGDLTP